MFETTLPSRRLALVGIVGPVVWWLLILLNGALTPGYSHIGDFISTLGAIDAPYASIQKLNFAVFGGSILALSLGIHHWFDTGRRVRVGTVLLGTFGVGVVLAGVFPEDPTAPESTVNFLHNLVSTVAFASGTVGVSLVSRRIRNDDRWPSYPYEWLWTVAVVLVTFVVFMYSVFTESEVVGFTQRVFVGVLSLWVVMQSYRLYRILGTTESPDRDEKRTVPAE